LIGYIKQYDNAEGLLNKIRNLLGIVDIEIFEFGVIINLPKSKKISSTLIKKIEKLKIDIFILGNNLSLDLERQMKEELKNIKFVNGRKLIEYMQLDIWEYILKVQEKNISQEDIFFLIKKDNKLDLEFLIDFVKKCKTVNIITNDIEKFKKIQEKLYEKENILISVSNNKVKALKKAKYIININMNEREISKYKINRDAIIINIREKFRYTENGFAGININDVKLQLPDEILESFEKINNICGNQFSEILLYEAFLLKKISNEIDKSIVKIESNVEKMYFEQAKRIIKKDEVKIYKLIGNNGEINTDELIKIYTKQPNNYMKTK